MGSWVYDCYRKSRLIKLFIMKVGRKGFVFTFNCDMQGVPRNMTVDRQLEDHL